MKTKTHSEKKPQYNPNKDPIHNFRDAYESGIQEGKLSEQNRIVNSINKWIDDIFMFSEDKEYVKKALINQIQGDAT